MNDGIPALFFKTGRPARSQNSRMLITFFRSERVKLTPQPPPHSPLGYFTLHQFLLSLSTHGQTLVRPFQPESKIYSARLQKIQCFVLGQDPLLSKYLSPLATRPFLICLDAKTSLFPKPCCKPMLGSSVYTKKCRHW